MTFIQVTHRLPVAEVTLNRPELHNAFNDEMIRELTEIFLQLGQEKDIRAILLRAEGKSFCAGADLNWMQSMRQYTFEENCLDAEHLARMLKTVHDCPKPVIGRVHGAAFGGGVGLVSVCDLSIALESATFSLSEVKLGLLPAVISPFVLEKIPVSAAKRYFMTAERFSAHEAHRIGLVSTVITTVDMMDHIIAEWVEALCQNGPEAVSLCKPLIAGVAGQPIETAIPFTVNMIAERRVSDEGQEGMTAFLEKRDPAWKALSQV